MKAAYPTICLMWPSRLAYALVDLYKKVLKHLYTLFPQFLGIKTHQNSFLKRNIFTVKTMHINLLIPFIWDILKKNFIKIHLTKFTTWLYSWEGRQIFNNLDHTRIVSSHFYFSCIPHSSAHRVIFLWKCVNGKTVCIYTRNNAV